MKDKYYSRPVETDSAWVPFQMEIPKEVRKTMKRTLRRKFRKIVRKKIIELMTINRLSRCDLENLSEAITIVLDGLREGVEKKANPKK